MLQGEKEHKGLEASHSIDQSESRLAKLCTRGRWRQDDLQTSVRTWVSVARVHGRGITQQSHAWNGRPKFNLRKKIIIIK